MYSEWLEKMQRSEENKLEESRLLEVAIRVVILVLVLLVTLSDLCSLFILTL